MVWRAGVEVTPEQSARCGLTDYYVSIISRVIDAFQATETLKRGTRQWCAELWLGDTIIDNTEWQESLQETARAAETLLICQERTLEIEAERDQNDPSCLSCEGTGIGWPAQARCSVCGGSGIARKEKAEC